MRRWYPLRGLTFASAVVLWLAGCALSPVLRAEAIDDSEVGVLTTADGSETRIRFAELSYTGVAHFVWPDGRSYSGDFVKGQPHGHGIEQLPDGSRYDGDWTEGRRGAVGTLIFGDGSRYDGQFEAGKRNGQGLFQSTAGRYQGAWIDDMPQGEGRFDYSDGASYEGFWLGGRRNGFGNYHRNDGSSYEGDWADDVPDGYGHLIESNNYSYEGGWRDGQRTGYGAMRVGEHFGYEGTWAANVRQGYGRESRPDGSEYTGEWSNDQRDGRGTLQMSNGASYEGYWQHNAPIGPGTRTSAEGIEITGTWDGDFVARGALRLPSGDAYEGNLYDPTTKAVDSRFLEWLQNLANSGNPDAALLLGHAYRYFLQPAPDRTQASLWYDRAAQAGRADAQYQLATILFEESGSMQRGLQLLLSAAAQGHAAANSRLGVFYQQGTYVEKDHAKAQRYYEAAIVEGDLSARNNLAWLLATSPSVELRDGKRAIILAQPLAVLYESWGYLDTLAAAEAEAGDFAAAARTEQRAIAQAETGADPATLQELKQRLTLFERAEPYREP
jgi:TPR repeat protein